MKNQPDKANPADQIKKWVELYTDVMYSWALHKTSSKEEAEDLVQETFMAAVQSINNFKGDSNPKTWLFSILNHKINDHYRKSFRKPVIEEDTILERLFDSNHQWNTAEKPQNWIYDSDNLMDNADFQAILNYCMHNLPANWFSAVQLKYLEEKKSELICQELQITTTNFWQILHRAKLQLRKCLELNWFKR